MFSSLLRKGLRKLRHSLRYSYIIWGYETYNEMLSEMQRQLASLKREEAEKTTNGDILQADVSVL